MDLDGKELSRANDTLELIRVVPLQYNALPLAVLQSCQPVERENKKKTFVLVSALLTQSVHDGVVTVEMLSFQISFECTQRPESGGSKKWRVERVG